ncbi:Elongation factor P, partial [Bienertia sinuspersici]
ILTTLHTYPPSTKYVFVEGDNYEEWSRSLYNKLAAKKLAQFPDSMIKVLDSKIINCAQWGIMNCTLVMKIYNTLDVIVSLTIQFKTRTCTLKLKAQIADCSES